MLQRQATYASGRIDDPLEVLAKLHAAVQDLCPWPQALAALCAYVEADAVQLWIDNGAADGQCAWQRAYQPTPMAVETANWMAVDRSLIGTGQWRFGRLPRVLLAPRFAEALGGCGTLATRVDLPDGFQASLAFLRAPQQPVFCGRQQHLAAVFTPHLPVMFSALLGRIRHRQDEALATALLERLAVPVALIEPGGTVRTMTAAAEAWIATYPYCQVVNGRLRLASGPWPRLSMADAVTVPQRVVFERSADGEVPAQLLILPLAATSPLSQALWMVCFIGAPATVEVDGVLCAGLFGLSRAEIRIVSGLSAGNSLETIAAAHGLSVHTVRTQLRPIFHKLGVRRLVDLVQILSALPLARLNAVLPPSTS